MLQRLIERKNRCACACVLTLVSGAIATAASGQNAQLEVRTLANEGVALTDGRQTVLIDALFDGGVHGYRTLDAETRARLVDNRLGLPPIALVFASHAHRDHFDAGVVLEFLARHTAAHFVGTPQAASALHERIRGAGERSALGERVHGLFPDEAEPLVLDRATLGTFDGRVTLLNLHHGREGDPPTQNLGILIEMAGLRALHIGDTEVRLGDVQDLPWRELDVDIGLFPYWFLVKSHYLEVTDVIGPEHHVGLHVPTRDAPASYFRPARSLDGLLHAIRTEFPEALIALEPGQRRRFSPTRRAAPE